jgi:hypothetical protein
MKMVASFLKAGPLFGAGESAWVPEFTPLRGRHCESSAMLNMLVHEGYGLTEDQILGAGAVLGFVFEFSTFPFLGGRSLEMKEHAFRNLHIPWHAGDPTSGGAWDHIHGLLASGHPVVLRVDMRYLPYLYGGTYGPKRMSFGWHMICIAGIDAARETTFVTDTDLEGLCEIRLKDLHRARFSSTEVLPPGGEFYWVDTADPSFRPNWEKLALDSLDTVSREMAAARSDELRLAGLDGLSRLPEALATLDRRLPRPMLAPALEHLHGCIETFGTGGAAFRRPYANFLAQCARDSGNERLVIAARRAGEAATAWSRLALAMRDLARSAQPRGAGLGKLGDLAAELYRREAILYETT